MDIKGKKELVVYTSERHGSDETGDGSKENPFKSTAQAITSYVQRISLMVDATDVDGLEKKYEKLSLSKSKTLRKNAEISLKKAYQTKSEDKDKPNGHDSNESFSLELNESLPAPIVTKIGKCDQTMIDKRVKLFGWVMYRRQMKNRLFIDLRDGTGMVQCVFEQELLNSFQVKIMHEEASVCVYGVLKRKSKPGRSFLDGVEVAIDYVEIIGKSLPGGTSCEVTADSDVDQQLKKRHLTLRWNKFTSVMRIRSLMLKCFRDHYDSRCYVEITPPTMVQTMCEGGSTLFSFDYFGETAYLTQSSQLYLETAIPSLGDVYCIAQSYRAEKSKTRRHLAEYTHVEAECPFITFENLLERIEDLVCDVLDRILASPLAGLLKEMNPDLKPIKRPIRRMQYKDALIYLKENNILKEDGTNFVFGDDIPEAPERAMVDKIGEPIFMIQFPAELKSFYMHKSKDDRTLTDSVDLLLPTVGEVVGGSMRMWDLDELLAAFKKEDINPEPYYWYVDLRKYGTVPHGGYGLGLERLLNWICRLDHIRDVVMYPRFTGRCTP